jgi:hypothetical protein
VSSRAITLAAYGAVALVAAATYVASRLRPDRVPSLGAVVTWAMRRRSTQLALLLAWWWLGWHFATRR